MEEHILYGVLPVNKPPAPLRTRSARSSGKSGVEKSGHTGTLDADVSGVLLVLLENSCKVAKFLLGERKEYVTVMEMGKEKQKEVEAAFAISGAESTQTPFGERCLVKKLRIRKSTSW